MTTDTSPFRTLECSDPTLDPTGLRFVTVKSPALGRRADVSLYLPPGAEQVPDLPVVVLLHGVYGSHWAWALKGGAHLIAARLIEQGMLPPVALLMPSDGLWGDGSGYVPHRDHDPERWIVEEMPALARELVAGCSADSPLLLAGLSMGGFGALRMAGKYPQRIAAAAALSAVIDAAQLDELSEEDRHGWSRAAADRDVFHALTGADGLLPPLWLACGTDDPYLQANRVLHRSLQRAGIAHLYREDPGGHEWSYWSALLPALLGFFGAVLRGAARAEPTP